MFELKLTFSTAEALYAAVAKLAGESSTLPVVTPQIVANQALAAIGANTAPAADAPKRPGRPRKEKEAPPADPVEAEPEVPQVATLMVEEDAPSPAAEAPAASAAVELPSADEVKAAAERFNAAHGIAKLKQVLSKFNAARISEIDPADRAAFIAACGC